MQNKGFLRKERASKQVFPEMTLNSKIPNGNEIEANVGHSAR